MVTGNIFIYVEKDVLRITTIVPVEELSNSHPLNELFHLLDADLQILSQLKNLLQKLVPSASYL